jgi:Domain of unknown function (DUF6748)
MRDVTYIRVALFAVVLAALALSIDTGWQRPHAASLQSPDQQSLSVIADSSLPGALVNSGDSSPKLIPSSPKSVSSNSTYFTVRPDLRRCAAPLCGGYYVRPVNNLLIRCAGRLAAECHVHAIDWSGQPQVDAGKALLRGEVLPNPYGRFGSLGLFRVSESWQAASDKHPTDVFYRVRDRGVRCITFPCPSHGEMKLNSSFSQSIAGVDLTGAGASEELVSQALAAISGGEGVLVTGIHATVTGPGGKMPQLKATQFYLRAGKTQAMKPCIKTGCSSQVCSDKNVITTCEWRPEYACYQKAVCERQGNGNCGFTPSAELNACLSGR